MAEASNKRKLDALECKDNSENAIDRILWVKEFVNSFSQSTQTTMTYFFKLEV